MNKSILGILLLMVCLASNVRGQASYNKRKEGPLGESPHEADLSSDATLDKVEYMTGTVKINIPIYVIHVKDMTVPISISYSTHGKRLDEKNNQLGQDWSLNAGGQIVRQLQGLPDEDYNEGIGNNPLPFSSVNYSNL